MAHLRDTEDLLRRVRAGERVLFTTGEIADLLGVSHRAVRQWCDRRKLKPIVTPGGHRRISGDQVLALLEPASA